MTDYEKALARSNVFPTEIYRSMHTVTVRFRKNYFSDKNGKVLGYSIIVAEDNTKHTEGDQFLPGWRDVQKFSVWPPYQVKSNIFGPHQLQAVLTPQGINVAPDKTPQISGWATGVATIGSPTGKVLDRL